MTYKGLLNFFYLVRKKTNLPIKQVEDFEILTNGDGNNLFLVGKSEVGNIITIRCQFLRDTVKDGSAVLQTFNVNDGSWLNSYLAAGGDCGITQHALLEAVGRVRNEKML